MDQPKLRAGFFIWIVIALITVAAVALGLKALIGPREEIAPNACPNNLRMIEGAKATWALENGMPAEAIPTAAQLFGPTNYMREMPVCSEGGTYTLNPINRKPTCSIPGHTL